MLTMTHSHGAGTRVYSLPYESVDQAVQVSRPGTSGRASIGARAGRSCTGNQSTVHDVVERHGGSDVGERRVVGS